MGGGIGTAFTVDLERCITATSFASVFLRFAKTLSQRLSIQIAMDDADYLTSRIHVRHATPDDVNEIACVLEPVSKQ